MGTCDFCDEFAGGTQNAFARIYGRARRRSIISDEHFRVLPTIGQLVEGHLLIVPTPHFCALADLSPTFIEKLENLVKDVRRVLSNTYGSCIFFEHGIRQPGSGGCGIEHAHLHAVPRAADGVIDELQKELSGIELCRFDHINTVLSPNSSYVFFEDSSEVRHVFAVQHIPSQYLRRLVAEQIGKADWDWRKQGYERELPPVVDRLTPLFNDVPGRG